jgi:hypothetical protein
MWCSIVTILYSIVSSVDLRLCVLFFDFVDTKDKTSRQTSKFDLEADLCGPAAVPTLPRPFLFTELEDGGVVGVFGFAESTFNLTSFF